MTLQKIKKENIIYQISMSGKDIQIADVVSYPASMLNKDKIYLVTVSELKRKDEI